MFEYAIVERAARRQERRHGRLVADSPQRLGRGAAVMSRSDFRATRSARTCTGRASRPADMDRGLANSLIGVGQERTNRLIARAGSSIRVSVQTMLRRTLRATVRF